MDHAEMVVATVIVAVHDRGEGSEINRALQIVAGRGAEMEKRTIVVPG
jgi:hypothetical protein